MQTPSDSGLVIPDNVSIFTIFREFLLVGAISFGGGLFAFLQNLMVEKRKWITNEEFVVMLSISQAIPGLNSVNLAVLMGDKLRGSAGSVAAAFGLLMPGAVLVLVIGLFYGVNRHHPMADHVLAGIAAGAAGLFCTITWKTGKDTFTSIKSLLLVALTFTLMIIVKWPLYLILLVVLPIGLFVYRPATLGIGENQR